MSVGLATMGKFLPAIGSGGGGGAIVYQKQENEHERHRMIIKVTSLNTIDKEESPLKIILKCSDKSGDLK